MMPALALCAGCFWVKTVLYDATLNKSPDLASLPGINFVTDASPYLICIGGGQTSAGIGRIDIPIGGGEAAPSQFKVTSYNIAMTGNPAHFALDLEHPNTVMRWMHHDTKTAPEYQYQYIDTGFRNTIVDDVPSGVCFKVEMLDTKDQPKNLTLAFVQGGGNVYPSQYDAYSGPWSLVDETTGELAWLGLVANTATMGAVAIRVSGRIVGTPT